MLSGCLENPHPSSSFCPPCCHALPAVTAPRPISPAFSLPMCPPQGLVPAVWTGARGVGSPAPCAGPPGSSSPPSELHTGSSTLHTSARPEPGTAEGMVRQEEGALGVPGSYAAGSHAAQSHPGSQPQGLHSIPAPVCSAVAAPHSFSPPAPSAVTPWPSAHSCFSGLPSPITPFSFPKADISVNFMQFNKHILNFCVPTPWLGYRKEKNLLLAPRAEIPVTR